MDRKTLLWLAAGATAYYLWRRGRLRVTPVGIVPVLPRTLTVAHIGTIDIPVDALMGILNTAIKRLSPF